MTAIPKLVLSEEEINALAQAGLSSEQQEEALHISSGEVAMILDVMALSCNIEETTR